MPSAPQSAPVAFAAQRLDPALLNSERIKLQFGSYGVEVLEHGARTRVSNLYSVEDNRWVCRTLAVVVFAPEVDPRLTAEHQHILAGGSIGAVLQAAGWTVGKRQLFVGEVAAPAAGDRLFALMDIPAGSAESEAGGRGGRLAIDVYEMVLTRSGGDAISYATIAEVYHPDYLDLDDLHVLYGREVPTSAAPGSELARVLELVEEVVRLRLPVSRS